MEADEIISSRTETLSIQEVGFEESAIKPISPSTVCLDSKTVEHEENTVSLGSSHLLKENPKKKRASKSAAKLKQTKASFRKEQFLAQVSGTRSQQITISIGPKEPILNPSSEPPPNFTFGSSKKINRNGDLEKLDPKTGSGNGNLGNEASGRGPFASDNRVLGSQGAEASLSIDGNAVSQDAGSEIPWEREADSETNQCAGCPCSDSQIGRDGRLDGHKVEHQVAVRASLTGEEGDGKERKKKKKGRKKKGGLGAGRRRLRDEEGEEEEDESVDDDWEAVADALNWEDSQLEDSVLNKGEAVGELKENGLKGPQGPLPDQNKISSHMTQDDKSRLDEGLLSSGNVSGSFQKVQNNTDLLGPPGGLRPEYRYVGNRSNKVNGGSVGRAWRPDDVARPHSLPPPTTGLSSSLVHGWREGGVSSRGRLGQGWTTGGGESFCPICTEELDVTDSSFVPCGCGFRLCLFCHHRIASEDGRCPGCRKKYVLPESSSNNLVTVTSSGEGSGNGTTSASSMWLKV